MNCALSTSGTVVTGMQTMFMLQVDAGDIIQVYHPTRYHTLSRMSERNTRNCKLNSVSSVFHANTSLFSSHNYSFGSILHFLLPYAFSLQDEARVVKMVLSDTSIGIR